jgi:nucleoid-associated protein YgaU
LHREFRVIFIEQRNPMMVASMRMQCAGWGRAAVLAAATGVALAAALYAPKAQAQKYPITSGQRATAQQVAQRGVPLSELAPNAPDKYVVKRGDTLWHISGMYLQRPWRWPELWGMNLQSIRNPHLIYPGQTLYLLKDGGYARLATSPAGEPETVRVTPRVRTDSLADSALPTLDPKVIEPFLEEPLIVDEEALANAPHIVATTEDRVLMAEGQRIYARGPADAPMQLGPDKPRSFRIYRDAKALKDPETGEILGYEAHYLGKAELLRSETPGSAGTEQAPAADPIPATLQLGLTKEEVRAGDRLLPAPPREFLNFIPRAPQLPVDARVVSVYGSAALANAAQSQVISLNRGTRDGMEAGQVLAILSKGARIVDKADPDRPMVQLPSERNGLAVVFRTFERVSYALIVEIHTPVRMGDKLTNPQ